MLPAKLNQGDSVAIVAPASPPEDVRLFESAKHAIKNCGYVPIVAPHATEKKGYLAGSDKNRASDINRMFQKTNVSAVVCIRGGYGTSRILEFLDYTSIKNNPKIFSGFSDITALHCAIFAKTGLTTLHGPSAYSAFHPKGRSKYTFNEYQKAVQGKEPIGSIVSSLPPGERRKIEVIRKGKVKGQLVGGNLAILSSLVGTPYLPSLKGKILFVEDVNEAPYRLDRYFTQLLLSGALKGVKGVALGVFNHCETKKEFLKTRIQTSKDVLIERLFSLKVPVVLNLPFGHGLYNATLPFGFEALLDGTNGDLIVEKKFVI